MMNGSDHRMPGEARGQHDTLNRMPRYSTNGSQLRFSAQKPEEQEDERRRRHESARSPEPIGI
jgi:hypothetical protein